MIFVVELLLASAVKQISLGIDFVEELRRLWDLE
jgi:hypothetical protein